MRQAPIFTSTSPHLGDHAANQYTLDYTLGGSQTAAVFSIMFCSWCGRKYAIVPQPGLWVFFSYEGHGGVPFGSVASDWPICIDVGCAGVGKPLTVTSLASIVTSEGQWLHLPRGVESA